MPPVTLVSALWAASKWRWGISGILKNEMEPELTVISQENSSQQQQDEQRDHRGHTQLHTHLLPI